MKTIKEVSDELSISKNTLRYYDKVGLVKPIRHSNKYRYYTEDHIRELKYILVMKYGGISLSEIKTILDNRRDKCNLESSVSILNNKKTELKEHIDKLGNILNLLNVTTDLIATKVDNDDSEIVLLVDKIYDSIDKEAK